MEQSPKCLTLENLPKDKGGSWIPEWNIRLFISKSECWAIPFPMPCLEAAPGPVRRVVPAWEGVSFLQTFQINASVRLDLWQKGSGVRCYSY